MELLARPDLHFRWSLKLMRVHQYIELKSKNSRKLALKTVQKCKVSLCKLQFELENTISTMLTWLYSMKGRNFKSVREKIAMGPSLRHHHPRWRKFTLEKIRRVDKSYDWTLAFAWCIPLMEDIPLSLIHMWGRSEEVVEQQGSTVLLNQTINRYNILHYSNKVLLIDINPLWGVQRQ